MDNELEVKWRWREGRVDTSDDHFKVMHGSEGIPVALVGRGHDECFTVEFLINDQEYKNGKQKILEKVKQEIDLVLVKKKKKDPWAYALLRGCSNNHHSEVRWGYFPRR